MERYYVDTFEKIFNGNGRGLSNHRTISSSSIYGVVSYIKGLTDKVNQIKTVREMIAFYEAQRKTCTLISDRPASNLQYGLECSQFLLIPGLVFHKAYELIPSTQICFEGYNFYAPNQPESYCRNIYGDIYRWPEDAGLWTHDV